MVVLLAAKHLAPPVAQWLGVQSRALRTVPAQLSAYEDASRRFQAYASDRRSNVQAATAALGRRSDEALRARRTAIDDELGRKTQDRLSAPELGLAAARGDSDKLFAHYRAQAEAALLQAERQEIDRLLSLRRERLSLSGRRDRAAAEVRASYEDWRRARAQVTTLEARFLADGRDAVCRLNPLNFGCEAHRALQSALELQETARRRNQRALREIAAIDGARRQLAQAQDTGLGARAALDAQAGSLAAEVRRLDDQARASWLVMAQRSVGEVLPQALLILAAAIIFPVLVKALLYFVVAPVAARRAAIRLSSDDLGQVQVISRSAVSQEVHIEPGEELLAAPQSLQSTPHHAAKRTRWLLSWRLPLSSLASGLAGLTEIRVSRADTALVSATGGPAFEIALVRVQAESALVLRPRALRGLLQEVDAPVRISRRWRFGASAWLTLQFRYLIFHGPGVFILQGTRGVRMEAAGRGRGINQAATLGFSPGLNYGVSRSETFGAYVFGKQALFNDSFEGNGAHLHEEMLPSERRRDPVGRTLQGFGDALLKLVGL